MTHDTTQATSSVAGLDYVSTKEALFLYPSAGDPIPPPTAKVLLLTRQGICTLGRWADDCIGWHPLPGRDKEKESKL